MRTQLNKVWALLLMVVLVSGSSCSTSGGLASPTKPKTIEQSLVYAQTTATSANTLAATLVAGRTITAEQAEEVGRSTAIVVATVKHARALLGVGNAADAQAQLAAITAELEELQKFINRNGGGS